MNTITVTPKDKEEWLSLRDKVGTSTDTPCLFGLSKYKTKYELWYEKSGQSRFPFQESERMKWGNRLESIIAHGVAEDKGWNIRPMKEFIFDEGLRIGSSFDFQIMGKTPAILEIKNVDSLIYNQEWTDDEAPAHIELQVQHQMLVSGLDKAFIVALVGGNEVKVIERTVVPEILKEIKEKWAEFWASVKNNTPPEPDFEQDAEFITKLYSNASGKAIDVSDDERLYDLATAYKKYGEEERSAKKLKDSAKAEILTIIGSAPKAIGADFTISAGEIGEAEITYTRKAYRNFRINWKGKKK